MIGSLTVEENVLKILETLAEHKGVSIGLVIGQVTSQKSYVIHLAPTPEQSKEAGLASFKDVDEARLGEHARYITRMLPGGLWVLGVFVISPDELITSANAATLKKCLIAIEKNISEGFCLHGKNPSGSSLILHYNTHTKKYQAKSFDSNLSETFKNVDWKFQNTMNTWCEINTEFYLKDTIIETNRDVSFYQELQNLLHRVSNDVNELTVHFADKEWEMSAYLDAIFKTVKGDQRKLVASLYRPSKKESSSGVRVAQSHAQLLVSGCLPSRIFLHPRATVQEAVSGVKQDILRSLSARLEMHWDSLVDDGSSPEEREQVHEPPRRVLLRPKEWKVTLTDFLFPGESIDQAIQSCRDLLNLEIDMDCIEATFEVPADAGAMLSCTTEMGEAGVKSLLPLSTPVMLLIAFVILLLALLFHTLLA